MSIDLITFEVYKSRNGMLERDNFEAVSQYEYTEEQINTAIDYIMDACYDIDLKHIIPDSDYEVAAKLIGVLGDKATKENGDANSYKMWLLTETYLLQGKDTAPIHEATFKKFE